MAARPRSRTLQRLVPAAAIAALTAATLLLTAIALPLAAALLNIDRPTTSADTWWTDGVRGGHYTHGRARLSESIDFRRIIFSGPVEQQPFYRTSPPPPWAAVISLDMREGFEQVVTQANGWPYRALRSESWIRWRPSPPPPPMLSFPGFTAPAPEPVPMVEHRGAIILRETPSATLLIPTTPVWTGLVSNLAIYAALWSIVLLTAPRLRALIRRRRKRCPRCGYPRSGLAPGTPCPECGEREARTGAGTSPTT